MKKIFYKIKWFSISVAVVAAGAFAVPHFMAPVSPSLVTRADAAAVERPTNVFSKIAREQTPAVVNISTKQKIRIGGRGGVPDERLREYYERFFPWFRDMPREQVRQSLGSGFVVEEDGYILTNNHVVSKADEIIVTFGDGHSNGKDAKEYIATLIGSDPKTDIAMIKIDVDRKLPTVELGDSEALQVGEWVIAIGNPFGFAQSVTVGVVSAKGRVIGAGPYDDFIQTDASINPGNSGGPLLDTNGKVVGINAAIYTGGAGQGNIGIGFAIPINLVKDIYSDLKKGRVKRGWLGVMIQKVTKELESALNLPSAEGALVGDVFAGSPAEKAGIKRGDVIVDFNGKKVASSDQLPRLVAAVKPGVKVDVKIIRDGKPITIKMKLGDMPDEKEMRAEGPRSEDLGMVVEELNPQMAERLQIEGSGVVVTKVAPHSPASEAGIRVGDVISEVNRGEVHSLDQYSSAIAGVKPGDSILMLVRRGRNTVFVVIKVPAEK